MAIAAFGAPLPALYENVDRVFVVDTVAEDERERLADDLHEEAIQLLAAARLRLQTASNDDRSPDLDAAHDLLGDGLLSLRRLILELKAPDVATGSLEELVRAYAERLLTRRMSCSSRRSRWRRTSTATW